MIILVVPTLIAFSTAFTSITAALCSESPPLLTLSFTCIGLALFSTCYLRGNERRQNEAKEG